MKPPLYLPLTVAGVFLVLFAAERAFPLRRPTARWFARLVVNAAISFVAFTVAAVIVQPSAVSTLEWASAQRFGLVQLLPGPSWARFIVGFLLLDLSFYYWHVANHRVPLLWRFHNVHHMDPDLDVSTGFRFHFGEVLLSTLFRVVQVSTTGISLATFAAYELVFQANTLFHHSNVRLPVRVERFLNRVLVTPRMHGIHHSQVRHETNSNYGVVFCWWDRLHRTLGLNVPQADIEVGIPGYSRPEDNRFWHTVIQPFRKQRDYWRKPDGTMPLREPAGVAVSAPRLIE